MESEEKFDTDRWCTTRALLEPVEALWPQQVPIGLDPCWDPNCIINPLVKFDIREGEDALELRWIEAIEAAASIPGTPRPVVNSVFYNGPYSSPGQFAQRAVDESFQHERTEIVGLMPPATGSQWWRKFVWRHARAICFIHGRRNFLRNGSEVSGNRYDSSYVLHASEDRAESAISRFASVMSEMGTVLIRRGGWSQA